MSRFINLMEVRADGGVKLHYRGQCDNFPQATAERLSSEAAIIAHVRELSGAADLAEEWDLTWDATSVCEAP